MNLKEIKEYQEELLQILFDIQVSVNNAKIISTRATEDEEWVKSHAFFKHYLSQVRFITIIQLSKLLSDKESQKFNFHKFLRKLESGKPPEQDELNRNKVTSKAEIKIFTDQIRSLLSSFEVDIQTLVYLRNKVYAHKDSPINGRNLSWQKIEALSEICFSIYNRILGSFFDTEFSFHNKADWGPEWIIKKASGTRPKKIKSLPGYERLLL